MTDQAWRSRCDWCGWPLKATVDEGCVVDNCSMRPMPTRNAAQDEVFELKRLVRACEANIERLNADLAEAHRYAGRIARSSPEQGRE